MINLYALAYLTLFALAVWALHRIASTFKSTEKIMRADLHYRQARDVREEQEIDEYDPAIRNVSPINNGIRKEGW